MKKKRTAIIKFRVTPIFKAKLDFFAEVGGTDSSKIAFEAINIYLNQEFLSLNEDNKNKLRKIVRDYEKSASQDDMVQVTS